MNDIEPYLASEQTFMAHRLRYYASYRTLPPPQPQDLTHQGNIDRLQSLKPQIIVATATHNRLPNLENIHQLLVSQQGPVHWAWVVSDNNSTDGTASYLAGLKDDRIIASRCPNLEGCAYPVRNHALCTIAASFWGIQIPQPWIIVIDSDDNLHNLHSLYELLQMTRSFAAQNQDTALVHGYSNTIIHYPNGVLEHVANPRDTSSGFPVVESLAETFYKGLNILGGAFPVGLLAWLRYPAERSFEDAGFNEKLMLQARKHHLQTLASPLPITVKNFHRDSMSATNDGRGEQAKTDQVGPYVVKGIRANIVKYYRSLTDYFAREGL